MRPLSNQSVNQLQPGSAGYFACESVVIDRDYLDRLWLKVCLNDFGSFEVIHKMLYPVLLKYANGVLNNTAIADSILTDTFVDAWLQRKSLPADQLKTGLLKNVRRQLLDYLLSNPKPVSDPDFSERPVNLLTFLNSPVFRDKEIGFLGTELKLNDAEIAEIMKDADKGTLKNKYAM